MPAPIIVEGSTATNPTTGEKIVYRGGKWYPLNQDPAASAADAKLTEDQGKSGEYLALMGQAERAYRGARTQGYDPTSMRNGLANYVESIPVIDGLAPVIRDSTSDNGRRAEMQWSDAQLKAMSGAASPEAEVRRNARTFFPGPGQNLLSAAPAFEDGRVTAMEAVRRRAGPAGRGAEPPTSAGVFGRTGGLSAAVVGIGGLMGGGLRAGSSDTAPTRPATPPAATPPAARAFATLPPATQNDIRRAGEGGSVTRGNGEVWGMRGGQPRRLR